MRGIPFKSLFASGLVAALPVSAHAQSEEGVFSSEGVQIHSDGRVYALYAVLNARGYDRETERGPLPTEAPRYHAIRARNRDKLKLGVDVEKAADAFLAAHPDAPARYLRAALELEDVPRLGVPEGATLGGYDGLARVLAQGWPAGVGEAYENDTPDLRKGAKDMLPVVDARSAELRKLFKLAGTAEELLAAESEGTDRVVVVLNPLDAHGVQLRHAVGTTRYVVVGPWKKIADKGVLDPVIVELARLLVGPEVRKVAAAPELGQFQQKAGPAGAAVGNAEAYALEVLSRAAARRVLGRALVLRTGLETDPELPGEADLLRELEAFAAGGDKLSAALPGMFGRASGAAPVVTPAPAPAPTPAVTPAPPPAKDTPKAPPAKDTPKAPPPKGGKPG